MLCFLMLSVAVHGVTKNILDLMSFAEGLNKNFLIAPATQATFVQGYIYLL